MVRRAALGDAGRIRALLASRGIAVSEDSVAERIRSEDGGVIVAGDGCLSWVLDGGVLHVYDIVGAGEVLGELLGAANAIGVAAFAAVVTTSLYADDPMVGELRSHGFTVDWEERQPRGGIPAVLVGLVCEVD